MTEGDDQKPTTEQRVERLEAYVDELLEMITQRDKLLTAICDNTESIWERIRTIQHSVFPNLADSLLDVDRVIKFTDDDPGREFDKRPDMRPPDSGRKPPK